MGDELSSSRPAQVSQGNPHNGGDLVGIAPQLWTEVKRYPVRLYHDPAAEGGDRCQWNSGLVRRQEKPDFLSRLAKRRRERRHVSRFDHPARKRDLAGMAAKGLRSSRQNHHRTPAAGIGDDERGSHPDHYSSLELAGPPSE